MIFKHKEVQDLPYPREFLYDVIADVESYPEFISWLSKVNVIDSYGNTVEYELIVDFKILKEKFSTKDVFYKPDRIEISLLDGPFKTLNNIWIFEKLEENKTRITFEIDFEFKSKLLAAVFAKLFVEAQKKILGAFVNRAHSLYHKEALK